MMTSILVETDLGTLVVDVAREGEQDSDDALVGENFARLFRVGLFDNCLVARVAKGLVFETGDPTGTGRGGTTVFGLERQARVLETAVASTSSSANHFLVADDDPALGLRYDLEYVKRKNEVFVKDERRHKGLVCMSMTRRVEEGGRSWGVVHSRFFILTNGASSAKASYADLLATHCVVGRVVEGLEVLDAIDALFVDDAGRPLTDVRLRRSEILVSDSRRLARSAQTDVRIGEKLRGKAIPSPDRDVPEMETAEERIPIFAVGANGYDDSGETELEGESENAARRAEERRKREEALRAENLAVKLEILGDLPSADIKPSERVLFICKLNPVTRAEDLELIFSRYGRVTSVQVVKDNKTGQSLQYGFIEFADRRACEEAYKRSQNISIDDRRVLVDFSQSVNYARFHGANKRPSNPPPGGTLALPPRRKRPEESNVTIATNDDDDDASSTSSSSSDSTNESRKRKKKHRHRKDKDDKKKKSKKSKKSKKKKSSKRRRRVDSSASSSSSSSDDDDGQ